MTEIPDHPPDRDQNLFDPQVKENAEHNNTDLGIGDADHAPDVAILINTLRSDPSEAARISAAVALGKSGDTVAIPTLIHALEDWPMVAIKAADALGAFGDAALDSLFQALGNDSDRVRYWAVVALRHLHTPQSIEPLLHVLADPDPTVRRSAAQALGDLPDCQARDPLIETLWDSDREVRFTVLDSLRRFALAHILDHDSTEVIIRIFVQQLGSMEDQIRQSGADGLEQFPNETAIPQLIRALNDHIPAIQVQAARALGATKSITVIDPLLTVLRSPILMQDTGRAAAVGLSQIGSASFSPLIHALSEDNPNVRFWVATALGYLGIEQAIPHLQPIAANDTERTMTHALVKTAAKQAIRNIQRRQMKQEMHGAM